MEASDIARLRLRSQQVCGSGFLRPADLVAHMGALQAQDYAMSKWAIGLRLPGSSDAVIEAASDKGEILRTHVLRPTWHWVSRGDIRWMLELTAPHILRSMRARHRQLELSPETVAASNRIIAKALESDQHLTREELANLLQKKNISPEGQRIHHLLLCAELGRVICSGRKKGSKNTYALFDARAGDAPSLPREEAIGRLARTYFRSHGPATAADFAWWSGLPAADVKRGMEMIRPDFIAERSYLLPQNIGQPEKNSLHLLPAFDEFIISYRDRSATLTDEQFSKAVSSNGLFRPVVVLDGKTIGTWSRSSKRNHVQVGVSFFGKEKRETRERTSESSALFGRFFGLVAEISFR